jgi:hypothetical protein
MAASYLTTVPSGAEPPKGGVVDIGRGGDTTAWRIRQLQLEARALGREQVEAFARDLGALATRAAEIAAGGDAYQVGARELAGRLADDLPGKVQLLLTLARRDG